jgi:hypothetical protein
MLVDIVVADNQVLFKIDKVLVLFTDPGRYLSGYF